MPAHQKNWPASNKLRALSACRLRLEDIHPVIAFAQRLPALRCCLAAGTSYHDLCTSVGQCGQDLMLNFRRCSPGWPCADLPIHFCDDGNTCGPRPAEIGCRTDPGDRIA